MAQTGREIAIEMERRFQGTDWMAELAERSGHSRDKVEWHLQEDMAPPDEIMSAADAMLGRGDEAMPAGKLDADDLPFSGLPGNLGKLRQD